MPRTLGFRDSLAAAFTNDTISYVLPDNIDVEKAPSSIQIDGYATLRMERTRILSDGTHTHMLDKAVRQSMRVTQAQERRAATPIAELAAAQAQQPRSFAQVFGCLIGAAVCGGVFMTALLVPMHPVTAAAYLTLSVLGFLVSSVVAYEGLYPLPDRTAQAA